MGGGTTIGRGPESAFDKLRDLERDLVPTSSVPPSRMRLADN